MKSEKIIFAFLSKDNSCYKEWQDRTIIEINDLPTLDELMEKFKCFCLAIGHHPNNVDKIQYVEEENDKDTDEEISEEPEDFSINKVDNID